MLLPGPNQALQPNRWPGTMTSSQHVYEIRPRKDKHGVDLISDALPFGRLWYAEPNAISNAVGFAKFFSRSHDAVIRVYDEAATVIETHESAGDFSCLTVRLLRLRSRSGLPRVRTA
jgi:hypothetical protein